MFTGLGDDTITIVQPNAPAALPPKIVIDGGANDTPANKGGDHLAVLAAANAAVKAGGSVLGAAVSLNVVAVGDSAAAPIQIGLVDSGRRIASIEAVYLIGSEADDLLLNDSTVPSVIDGRGGADWLSGGAAVDVIFGGTGVDVLFGGLGDDFLFSDQNPQGNVVPAAGVAGEYVDGGGGTKDSAVAFGDQVVRVTGSLAGNGLTLDAASRKAAKRDAQLIYAEALAAIAPF